MRDLNDEKNQNRYFEKLDKTSVFIDDEKGTREIYPLRPFVISGGKNTERGYFIGINKYTDYQFVIKPEYFGDESAYTEKFPQRIEEILRTNNDALIFCVFDMDTNYKNTTNKKKHDIFVSDVESLKQKYKNCNIFLCPSMPSIEYWFLLHFEETNELFTTCGKVNNRLSKHMKHYFSCDKSFGKLLKSACIVENVEWVEKLCDKIEHATKYAKLYIKDGEANGDLESHSYSYVYKIFDYEK